MIGRRAIIGILRADGLRLVRDRFLLGLALLIFGMCLALRFGLPWIAAEVERRWQFDLLAYFPLLTGHVVMVLPAVSVGLLGGFVLLESREERATLALAITPVPLPAYLWVVGVAMTLICTVFSLVHALLLGLPLPPLAAVLGIAFAASAMAPVGALFLASQANDKVEAMAWAKVVSGAAPIALAAYFLPEPWQWLAGVYPPYWAAKAYWVAEAGGASWPLWALGCPLTSAVGWVLLSRRFLVVARR